MQTYGVSQSGRIRAIILLVTIGVVALYAAQKAWGLWRSPAHDYAIKLVGLDMNNLVPAVLLTIIAVAAIPVGWYIVVELITTVGLDENGLLLKAPGYRIFYRWDEIESFDVITGPVEDAATALQVETQTAATLSKQAADPPQTTIDPVEPYLSEADLREDKSIRKRNKAMHKEQIAFIRGRAIRNDGTPLKPWVRLLYPQARRPDRLLLYPSLENRTTLLAQIEAWLARV